MECSTGVRHSSCFFVDTTSWFAMYYDLERLFNRPDVGNRNLDAFKYHIRKQGAQPWEVLVETTGPDVLLSVESCRIPQVVSREK